MCVLFTKGTGAISQMDTSFCLGVAKRGVGTGGWAVIHTLLDEDGS